MRASAEIVNIMKKNQITQRELNKPIKGKTWNKRSVYMKIEIHDKW